MDGKGDNINIDYEREKKEIYKGLIVYFNILIVCLWIFYFIINKKKDYVYF